MMVHYGKLAEFPHLTPPVFFSAKVTRLRCRPGPPGSTSSLDSGTMVPGLCRIPWDPRAAMMHRVW